MLKKSMLVVVLVMIAAVAGAIAQEAAKLSVFRNESIRTVLAKQTGAKVILKLKSGQEIAGTIVMAGDNVVHVGELAGKEFYDAVVDVNDVAAVIVRAR